MIVAAERVSDVQSEIQPLLEEHYKELTLNKDMVSLEVDWAKYKKLEEMNMLSVLTIRINGVLIGYSVFFVQSHIHYKSLKTASNDVLFLKKEYRSGSRAGLMLIKNSEKHLASLGVQKIIWHIKLSNDWSKILIRLGYVTEEVILGKLLGEHHGL
jgi:hypothetical protein